MIPLSLQNMKIFIERLNKKKTLKFKGRIKDLLKQLGLNPVTVLVVRNSELLTEDAVLSDADEIKIISVVSGG